MSDGGRTAQVALPADVELDRRMAELEVQRLSAALSAREAELERLLLAEQEAAGKPADDVALMRRELTRLRGQLSVGEEAEAAARRELERLRVIAESAADATRRVVAAEARADRATAQARTYAERIVELERRLGAEANAPHAGAAAAEAAQADRYRDRVRELEQITSALAVGLAATKADVARAAQSRAWRYGHGFSKFVGRLAGRRTRTDGALARALQRIDQVEQATLALPAINARTTSSSRMLQSGAAQTRTTPELPVDAETISRLRASRTVLAAEIRERLGSAPEGDELPAVSVVVLNRNGRRHLEWLVDGLRDSTDYPIFELVVVDNASSDDSVEYLAGLSPQPFEITVVANESNESFSAANRQGVERASHELLLFLNNDVEPFEAGWLREMVAALEVDGVGAVGATLLHVEEHGSIPTVQHRAVRFQLVEGLVRAVNDGDGDALFGERFGMEERAPAATAACLLVARSTFDDLGGFGDGYRYGTEDVDFGLKVTSARESVVSTGRAVLFHRESSTQSAEGLDVMRVNRDVNRRLLHERWGPRLRREYRLARLDRDPEFSDGAGPHVAITVTSLAVEDGWGDWYTAHEMGDALAALGWRVTYLPRKADGWLSLPPDLDHVLSLMDAFDIRTVPEDVLVTIWIRNWTERWLEREWFDRADVILASSKQTAKFVEQRAGRQSVYFPLATNPSRFSPSPDPALSSDYAFTGNRWGKERAIETALAPQNGERLAIYGRGWDQVKRLRRHDRGPSPYEALSAIYSSAKLVLDDTQGPTLPYGAVNCRVFDALASGTLVVTNCEAGVRELFDDDFPVWSSRESLRAQLNELLADDDRRETLARRYRKKVLAQHTYAHRAQQLGRVIRAAEEMTSFCLKIGAPDLAQAERWGDLHFARAIRKQLRRRGYRARIQTLDQWELLDGTTDDVVIHLKGLSRYLPKPGQFNVLWCISHPDELTGQECDGYDLICVASATFAAQLEGQTRTPVMVLEQATDPEVFFPDYDETVAHDLVYVANSRSVLRPIVRDLLPTDRDLAIWGANWEGLIGPEHIVAEHVPNEVLRKVYSSATVVLADHWEDMREHGFIANRIYDALACGAAVISDEVPGLTERFGGAVRTYRTPDELRGLIQELTGSALSRLKAGAIGRDAVLEGGTFELRVTSLLAALNEPKLRGRVAGRVSSIRALA